MFTTALLPFTTVIIGDAVQDSNLDDARTAVGLYSLIGALLCVSWLVFYDYEVPRGRRDIARLVASELV